MVTNWSICHLARKYEKVSSELATDLEEKQGILIILFLYKKGIKTTNISKS